jgi:hypothetical protein
MGNASSLVSALHVLKLSYLSMSSLGRYGEAKHPLPRKVYSVGDRREAKLDLRPARVMALLLVKDVDPAISGPPPKTVTTSSYAPVKDLYKDLINAVSPVANPPKARIWSVMRPRTAIEGLHYPVSRLLEAGGQIRNRFEDKTVDQALIEPGDVFVIELPDADQWLVNMTDVPGLGETDAEAPAPLFSAENNFFNRMQKTLKTTESPERKAERTAATSTLRLRNGNKAEPSAASLTATKTRTPGTMGLGNMYI